jgi:peptide/nickel transport system permease protein
VDEPLLPPSFKYPFGTDALGRNVFIQVLSGIRISVFVALGASLVAVVIGVIVGSLAGYYGGIVDVFLMRLTEVFMVIPRLVFAIVIAAILGASIWNVILVIGVLTWTGNARLMRGMFLSLKERTYVMAARSIGVSEISIIFKEILPNALFVMVVNTSFLIARSMLIESGLSFLGLGDPNAISLGFILRNARPYFRTVPSLALFPGAMLFIIILSFNVLGDGLNEALRPRSI